MGIEPMSTRIKSPALYLLSYGGVIFLCGESNPGLLGESQMS